MADPLVLFLALFFFAVGFLFWLMCWIMRTREVSLLAFWYAVVFEFAGFITLTLWRLTGHQ